MPKTTAQRADCTFPGRTNHGSAARTRGARSGFTLFEVALSLVLISFGVVSVMVLIPTGLRTQQKARFELLASTQALEMLEFFSGKSNAERIADFETPEPWEARPFCYTSTRWDLESRLSRWDSGIMPIPPDIARRLDSDNDEIRTLINQGANLYYADARSIPTIDPQYINVSASSEAQKLVFAVSGYAQNNAVPVFSYKAWPYRAAYPSPPLYAVFNSGSQFMPLITSNANSPIGSESSLEGWSSGVAAAQPPTNRDPLMDGIFQATVAYETALTDNIPALANREAVIGPLRAPLMSAILAYCTDKFGRITDPLGPLPVSGMGAAQEFQNYLLAPTTTDFVTLGQNYDSDFSALCQLAELSPGEGYNGTKATARAEIAMRVQCLRFLAFVMSTYYIQQLGEPIPNLAQVRP
jgi:Tfp pilus assembly protein PilV